MQVNTRTYVYWSVANLQTPQTFSNIKRQVPIKASFLLAFKLAKASKVFFKGECLKVCMLVSREKTQV